MIIENNTHVHLGHMSIDALALPIFNKVYIVC